MSSATDIDIVPDNHETPDRRRRTVSDTSLIAGIVLIVMFLGFFVLEFSRILSFAGGVHHTIPVKNDSASKPSERP